MAVTTQVFAANISYLPYVTAEMSDPSYWTDDNEVLMSEDEIKELNTLTIATKGTNMNNLKKQPDTVDGVAFCIENKLMQGYEDGFFYPENEITFAQFIQILYNLDGNKQSDASEKEWYTDAVLWATDAGIISEDESLTFEPDKTISREELVLALYKYALYKEYDTSVGEDTNILSYDDVFDISDDLYEAFQYVVGSSILKGKSQTTLNPKDNVTRAEMAAILQRFVAYNQ